MNLNLEKSDVERIITAVDTMAEFDLNALKNTDDVEVRTGIEEELNSWIVLSKMITAQSKHNLELTNEELEVLIENIRAGIGFCDGDPFFKSILQKAVQAR